MARMDEGQLVIRRRKYYGHGKCIYWIGTMVNDKFVPYHDVLGPTGYGHQSKEVAQQIMQDIIERGKDE
jgi:hypothetical protein